MACNSCRSVNQRIFDSKISTHFSGFGVAHRSVTVRPKLIMCLDCGRAEFHLSKDQLELLADRRPQRSAEIGVQNDLAMTARAIPLGGSNR